MFSPNRCASILDSRMVFPCSLVRMTAISSTFWSMWWAALCRISARLLFGSFDQVTNALAAAFAALSTSAGPPAGTSSTTSPVAGVRTSYVLPDAALVLSPSMIIVGLIADETLRKVENARLVFIAAIAGDCLGGGLELALACDLRFAAEGAYQIGRPEVNLGLFPGSGGTQRLPRLVGLSRGLDMIATATTLKPADAKEPGIVDRLYPDAPACRAPPIPYPPKPPPPPALPLPHPPLPPPHPYPP